jgi:hypothetical protein
VTVTNSPLLTNALYTNTRCSTGQVSIATEVANPEEKNADNLVPPAPLAYLLSTTHSKDVRFPWFTLYLAQFFLEWKIFQKSLYRKSKHIFFIQYIFFPKILLFFS